MTSGSAATSLRSSSTTRVRSSFTSTTRVPILEDACPKGFQFLDDLRLLCSRPRGGSSAAIDGHATCRRLDQAGPKKCLEEKCSDTGTHSVRVSIVDPFQVFVEQTWYLILTCDALSKTLPPVWKRLDPGFSPG